ncbi:MAG TPA: AAA family ATPase [Trebonia sp.]|nr:AAA family ATPase [Trebonia sp.]
MSTADRAGVDGIPNALVRRTQQAIARRDLSTAKDLVSAAEALTALIAGAMEVAPNRSRRLDQLTQIAASRGATVRLLGDDRQLPAVESGGALQLIATQPGIPCLTMLHRLRDPAEAAATLQVRAGDGVAVEWYASNGRVRSGSREAMTQAAYTGWKADMLTGKVT